MTSTDKSPREFWIRTKVFSNDGYAFGNPEQAKHEINVPIIHVIEHSAYLAVKQELEAARADFADWRQECDGTLVARYREVSKLLAEKERELARCAEVITCIRCSEKTTCPYAYDGYNTNGDCLAEK
jgi:predicted lipase